MIGSTERWRETKQLSIESHSAASQQYDLKHILTLSLSFLIYKRILITPLPHSAMISIT